MLSFCSHDQDHILLIISLDSEKCRKLFTLHLAPKVSNTKLLLWGFQYPTVKVPTLVRVSNARYCNKQPQNLNDLTWLKFFCLCKVHSAEWFFSKERLRNSGCICFVLPSYMFKVSLISYCCLMGQTESMGDPIFNTLPSQRKCDTHPYHLHTIGENKSCAKRAGKIQLLAEQPVPSNKQLYSTNPW